MFAKPLKADRRMPLAAMALASLLAGCAMPILPADSIDAVRMPNAAAPAVDIDITQDAQRRLVVRYRAPDAVTHLDFVQHDARVDSEVRKPLMKPANDCGALVPGGIALRHGAGCERGAVFEVQPRTMMLYAMNEPAQPTSDGAVLFYTGYYAAVAPGLRLRWHFTPRTGDYGIDDSRRHDAAWQLATESAYDGPKPSGDQRDDQDWIRAQHASHYVFLGHTPISPSDGMLWIRDPALPPVITDTVGRAGPLAWDAYARATGRTPEGQVTVVMMSAVVEGSGGFQGDRTDGNVLRLSFVNVGKEPGAQELSAWSRFVAHETAHLWNHGVYASDMKHPWLHEGDADWVSLNAMHDAGLVSDAIFVDEIQSHVDNCLTRRGEHPAATLAPYWGDDDDPYGCGFALQLLGFARVHAARPDATPLAVWGALHRAHPMLDATGFAQFFDQDNPAMFAPLLLDDKTPFASTYRADLATVLPLHEVAGEPAAGAPRRQVAWNLMLAIGKADCGRTGFTLKTHDDRGEFALDDDLACKSLPAGAHLTTVAGQPIAVRPRAAWQAIEQSCAARGSFEAGFDRHAPVTVACPKPMPALAPQMALPDDVLQRLGLAKKNTS